MAKLRKYSLTLANEICDRLSDGESLRRICADARMPDVRTAHRWLASKDKRFADLRAQYLEARALQAETMGDDMLDIADDARNDWMQRHGQDDAGWQVNGEHIQRSRLRIETRKWLAVVMAPKKYGPVTRIEHSGPDGGPITLSDIEAAAKVAALLAAAKARQSSGED